MKAASILKQLDPFILLSDKSAMSPVYRVLCFYPEGVQAISPYAALDITLELGVADSFFIDSAPFFAVLRSVPSDQELEMTVADGALNWKCGTAKGRLALTTVADWPDFPAMIDADNWFKPTADFGKSLELGGLSCGGAATATQGIYGVAFENVTVGTVRAYSCDNETTSCYTFDNETVYDAVLEPLITLSPQAAKLIRAVVEWGSNDVNVQMDAQSVNIIADNMTAVIKQIPGFKRDIKAIVDAFSSCEAFAPLPEDRVKSFAQRTNALVENRQNAKVLIGVAGENLTLAFADGIASSEEYYLLDELKGVPDLGPISVDASRLANVLQYTDKVAFDHAERGVLVFASTDGKFVHIVSGVKHDV